jgi:hypothetical protein
MRASNAFPPNQDANVINVIIRLPGVLETEASSPGACGLRHQRTACLKLWFSGRQCVFYTWFIKLIAVKIVTGPEFLHHIVAKLNRENERVFGSRDSHSTRRQIRVSFPVPIAGRQSPIEQDQQRVPGTFFRQSTFVQS